jgi:hypothetical protein
LETKELAVASLQRTISHFLFTREFFYQETTWPSSPIDPTSPPVTSLFPQLKILKGHHFETTEVIEAELQAVLNTLTEHDFQDSFKNWQKRWKRCI